MRLDGFRRPRLIKYDNNKGLNLSVEEYEVIRDFDPTKRQFLIKRQDEQVICTLDLRSLGNHNLRILSIGSKDIEIIDSIFQQDIPLEAKIKQLQTYYKEEA
ncbi:hypothetical protein [Helicobacter trogontum]|uniref:Uncharacterized protein n=1 Tax=Helicobacter trogontum TaxID=50960 RepID=A0A4U8T724_9HELI|nr:hypothetical protein [Helicobacter trogontum]MDY5185376.1 hypothetical protein [Helicobacter trogontum]TLD95371.1 hypothetical protein LS80_009365 [Helicobacter trogontum]